MRALPARQGWKLTGKPAGASEIDRHYLRVTDRLVADLEQGTAPWTLTWRPGPAALPYNPRSAGTVNLVNQLWLASVAQACGYRDPRWCTYRQALQMGWQVRRGQKGTPVIAWSARPGGRPEAHLPLAFNAEQCRSADRLERPEPDLWQECLEAERLLERSGAVIETADTHRAWYDFRRDRIVLPPEQECGAPPAYHRIALHELGHWTGHPHRLDRATLARGIESGFASPDYAREELRAEIGSLVMGDRLGIGHDPSRHVAYVGAWIGALRNDPREIFRAAGDARKLSNLVLGLSRARPVGPGQEVGPLRPSPLFERGGTGGPER